MNEQDVDELLERAYESEDPVEVEELVDRALMLEPDNPEALLLRADLTEDDGERLATLERAIRTTRLLLDEERIEEEELAEDELGSIYLALLQRAAFTLFSLGDDARALETAEELLRYDLEDQGAVRSLYYRILIEQQEWSRILSETMQDEDHQLGWAYARLCAAFMLSPEGNLTRAAQMFWDALILSPNAPFYMLGYFAEPVDGADGSEEEDFHFGLLYSDVWSISRDLLNWFSRGVILFGLLTGRFGEESGDMLEILGALGGREEYDRMDALLGERDDDAVIEALAAHRCLAER